MKKVLLLVSLAFFSLFGCQPGTNQPAAEQRVSLPLHWGAISDQLIKEMNLQPGERVLIVAQPGDFDPLISKLGEDILSAGAVYLGTISVDSTSWPVAWQTDFTRASIGKTRKDLTTYFNDVDLGIMLPEVSPSNIPYESMRDLLMQGKGRTIHFHWSGAYDLSGKPVPIDSAIHQFYQKALLQTDYEKLSAVQEQFEKAIRAEWVIVTTPAGTHVKFRIGDRPVTKQDGDASNTHSKGARNLIDREVELPAGAIRVAPIEESVEGTIVFPTTEWAGKKVEGLVVRLQAGKITSMNANAGIEAVKEELDRAGEAGHSFREFALGFNPALAIPEQQPWIPYYGYGAGVVRLSLGDNSELGGKVTGGYVRWNFFPDATVKVGQVIWVKDGKMVAP